MSVFKDLARSRTQEISKVTHLLRPEPQPEKKPKKSRLETALENVQPSYKAYTGKKDRIMCSLTRDNIAFVAAGVALGKKDVEAINEAVDGRRAMEKAGVMPREVKYTFNVLQKGGRHLTTVSLSKENLVYLTEYQEREALKTSTALNKIIDEYRAALDELAKKGKPSE